MNSRKKINNGEKKSKFIKEKVKKIYKNKTEEINEQKHSRIDKQKKINSGNENETQNYTNK